MYKPQYINLVESIFFSPKELIAVWLSGLNTHLDKDPRHSEKVLHALLKVEASRRYIFTFLERDYYRHLQKRRRNKPSTNFYSVWFGDNQIHWGLLIQPRSSDDGWINKIPSIEKVPFDYWTVGHVMSVGLVDPENNELITFRSIEELQAFIIGILKRLSRSDYEKRIYDLYVKYLNESENPYGEPFLIPEFRYAGLQKDHRYRLDFTVLNIYTNEMVGFEISPQSTHMSVSKIKDKTQKKVNQDIGVLWEKEVAKRNDYFNGFGISIITFTDSHLEDIDIVFGTMKTFLEKRESETQSIQSLMNELINREQS